MSQPHARSALLLLDLQNEMVDPQGYFGASGLAKAVAERNVLTTTRKVLDAARAAGMTVVFVRLGFRSDYSDSLSVAPRVAKFKAAGNAEMHRFAMEKILPMFSEVKNAATFLAEVRA